jgi:2-polyprenyl-3-methyl-5-hydroxy-6-metoxy-1,4-benzoquinol methylase
MIMEIKSGEYAEKGEYHEELDKNWPYYPIYISKMNYIMGYISDFPKDKKILDLGCGEGVLVKELDKKGYNIAGMDLNYQSELITKGDITNTGLESETYDLILNLDVIEHLNFDDQEKALKEMHRILKSDGILMISIPNLAHLASRISFLISGKLLRTSEIERHKGDRPIKEYIKMMEKYFIITKRKGIFPTFPISSYLTYKHPSKVLSLHRVLNTLFANPNWCFLNIFICKKK